VQLTLWQRIGDSEQPIELTIQRGRGLIYLDGLRFHPDPPGAQEPEMCVLVSGTGLFSSARIVGK